MFTFLPKENRAQVEREYRRRIFSIAFGLLALLLLSAAVFATPTYVIMLVRRNSALIISKNTIEPSDSTHKTIEARVSSIKTETSALKATSVSTNPTLISVIERINSRIISGITLNSISIKRVTSGTIQITGFATTRDILVSFTKSLQGEPSFKNVSLPVSALAKGKDIGFSITIDSNI